jgi:hypothetical protein
MVAVTVALFHVRLYNVLLGPFPIELTALETVAEPPFRQWITVVHQGQALEARRLRPTELVEVSAKEDGTRADHYHRSYQTLGLRGDALLLVKVVHEPREHEPVVGLLRPNDEYPELAAYGPTMLVLDENYELAGWLRTPRVLPPPLS